MSSPSTTTWLERLQAGDPRAAQALWERLAQRMLAAARQRLGSAPRRVADEEDVVVSFGRCLDGVRDRDVLARLPTDEHQCWQTLWQAVADLLKPAPDTEGPKADR